MAAARMSDLWTPNRGLGKVEGGWQRDQASEPVPGVEPGARVYRRGECAVIVGRHPSSGWWHLSISTKTRLPSWEEVRDARYSLLPDRLTFAMLLPPRDEYLNVHDYTFHLHQIDPLEDR
jgi:hypothetical protein